jgi:hypothetical protein
MKKVCVLGMPLLSLIQLEKGEHVDLPSRGPASAERLAGRSAVQAGTARWNGVFGGQTTCWRGE